MELNVVKRTKVKATTLKINMKACDSFSCELLDQDGDIIAEQEGDYVPKFMPGNHYGDYLILDIDVNNGQILNWDNSKVWLHLSSWVDEHTSIEE